MDGPETALARAADHDLLDYYDPVPESLLSIEPYTPRLSVHVAAPVVTLVSNMFVDASEFLNDLRDPLAATMRGITFKFHDKGHRRNSSFPLGDEVLDAIAAQSDAVITGFGHCGSCTAATIRDAVAFAKRGVPVAPLITAKFHAEARFVAEAAGISDLPLIVMPHPVAGRDTAYHCWLASHLAPRIRASLFTGETVMFDEAPMVSDPSIAA